jgi:hypothetical protein
MDALLLPTTKEEVMLHESPRTQKKKGKQQATK